MRKPQKQRHRLYSIGSFTVQHSCFFVSNLYKKAITIMLATALQVYLHENSVKL